MTCFHRAFSIYFLRNTFLIFVFLFSITGIAPDTVLLRDGRKFENVKTKIKGSTLEIYARKTVRVPVRDVQSILPGPVVEKASVPKKKNEFVPVPPRDETEELHSPISPDTATTEEDSDRSLWMMLAGPVPGWSPLYSKNRTAYAIASGGIEIAGMIPALVMMPQAKRPGLERYLIASYLLPNQTTSESTSSGSGSGNGAAQGPGGPLENDIATEGSETATILRNALLLQIADRYFYNPVVDPFHTNRYISRSHFNNRRKQTTLLFLSLLVADSLTSLVPAKSESDEAARDAVGIQIHFSVFPEFPTDDPYRESRNVPARFLSGSPVRFGLALSVPF